MRYGQYPGSSPASVYSLIEYGPSPVSLSKYKDYAKIGGASQDALITSLISTVTTWCEGYTGRAFRKNKWELLLDVFPERIHIFKPPVGVIDSITHIVAGSPVIIPAADYYLKKLTQFNEVLLVDGKGWPENTDIREQAITISFTTEEHSPALDRFDTAVKRLVAYLYENRGDCACDNTAATEAGATDILDQFRIARI